MSRLILVLSVLFANVPAALSGTSCSRPEIYPNGTFVSASNKNLGNDEKSSPNGVYTCTFSVVAVNDEMRVLKNFTFYKNGTLMYTLSEVPGCDVEISNNGFCVFHDFQSHFMGKHILHFFNKTGKKLFTSTHESASLFGFSQQGNLFGVGSRGTFETVNLSVGSWQKYPACTEFAFSSDETMITLATDKNIRVYKENKQILVINNIMPYLRKVALSPDNKMIAVINKKNI